MNAPGAGGPAYGRTASSCGRPISTTSLSSTPTSASAYRSRAAGPATHTSSYAFAYGLHEDSLSLSPWLTKACLMVGMRRTWEVFPELEGWRRARSVECSRRISVDTFGRHTTGMSVAAIRCTMCRSRSTITGRPSSRASGSSHMFAWYAEDAPPEKYRPTVGRYRVSHASNQSSTSCSPAGRRPGSSRSSSAPRPVSASARDSASPAAPYTGASVAAVTSSPAVAGSPKAASRCPGRRSSAGGAGVSRSAEASMLRVTTGSVRVRRTRTDTAWIAQCAA
ncbi:hypothetical protein BZZ08_03247 [Streptomyces sp. MH60]|nr:hypothetical protein BZZ08_03247 [Streptomyces sp. MH60]